MSDQKVKVPGVWRGIVFPRQSAHTNVVPWYIADSRAARQGGGIPYKRLRESRLIAADFSPTMNNVDQVQQDRDLWWSAGNPPLTGSGN